MISTTQLLVYCTLKPSTLVVREGRGGLSSWRGNDRCSAWGGEGGRKGEREGRCTLCTALYGITLMVLIHRSRGQWPTMRSLRASASGFPSSRGIERWVGSVVGGCGYKEVVGAVMGGGLQ